MVSQRFDTKTHRQLWNSQWMVALVLVFYLHLKKPVCRWHCDIPSFWLWVGQEWHEGWLFEVCFFFFFKFLTDFPTAASTGLLEEWAKHMSLENSSSHAASDRLRLSLRCYSDRNASVGVCLRLLPHASAPVRWHYTHLLFTSYF